jgi:autotransporter adhesin
MALTHRVKEQVAKIRSVLVVLGGAIRRITQVTDGVDDKDAINVSQLNDAIAGLTSGAELITTADGLLTTEKSNVLRLIRLQ